MKKSVTLLYIDAFTLRLSLVDGVLDRTFDRSFAVTFLLGFLSVQITSVRNTGLTIYESL